MTDKAIHLKVKEVDSREDADVTLKTDEENGEYAIRDFLEAEDVSTLLQRKLDKDFAEEFGVEIVPTSGLQGYSSKSNE